MTTTKKTLDPREHELIAKALYQRYWIARMRDKTLTDPPKRWSELSESERGAWRDVTVMADELLAEVRKMDAAELLLGIGK